MSNLNSLKPDMLPPTWQLLPVGKLLLDTQYGTNEPSVENGNTKVVGMKDIQNGKVILDDLSRSDLSESERNSYILTRGDLLLNRTNSYDLVGKVGIFDSDDEIAFASYLVRLKVDKEKIVPIFLNFWLNGNIAQTVVKKIATRAISQANVNPTEFKKHCLVPVPSTSEQTAIANLLSTWDEAVENAEKLITAMEKRYKWLSGNLLFRSPSNTDMPKKTRWFAVPEHWKIVKIGVVAKEIKAINNAGENIPVLSCTKYHGLVDSLSYFGKQVFSLDTSTYKVVSKGEFAYATNHIEEGSIGYQDFYVKGLVSPMYTVFKTSKTIDDGYLYKVLKTETYRHIFQVNTSASVDRRGSLRWNEFAKLTIPVPPIEEQQKISETLNVARQKIDLLKQQADAMRRQKRGLMQKLLTGVWRLKMEGENDH